jgi:hypothetical protein
VARSRASWITSSLTATRTTVQQPRGKGALGISSPVPTPPALIGNGRDAIFMNRDVVEIAEAILHAFQRREKLLPTLRRLLAREEPGKELRCVSHLLGLYAQLVTAVGVEAIERFALLADFLEAARQLHGGANLDRDITTIAFLSPSMRFSGWKHPFNASPAC